MSVPTTVLSGRRALVGLAGATVLLALAASATFAAGFPGLSRSNESTPAPSRVAGATATDRDADATLGPIAKPTSETSAESAEPSPVLIGGDTDLVGACNALHGQAYAVIGGIVADRTGDGTGGHNPASSAAPVVPPGLQKVYDRLQECASSRPSAAASPTATPSEPTPEGPAPSQPAPTATPKDHEKTLPSPADDHGHGVGRGH